MRYCDYCGAPLNDNDKKCKSCYHECKPIEEEIEMPEPKLKFAFKGKDKVEDSCIDEEKREKRKKLKGKVPVIISACLVGVILLASVIGTIIPKSSKDTNSSYDYDTDYTEETTVDNSVSGEGYYDFDNKFNQDTVDKFLSVWDSDGSASKVGLGVSLNDFSYLASYDLLGRDIDLYSFTDFNGKTASSVMLDTDKKVVAYKFTYMFDMWTDGTTTDTYKSKQLIERPAAWLYALSDDESYDDCFELVKQFQSDVTDSYIDEDVKPYYYHDGYIMLVYGNTDSNNRNIVSLTFMKTDDDFGEKHNIANGQPSIFQEKQ